MRRIPQPTWSMQPKAAVSFWHRVCFVQIEWHVALDGGDGYFKIFLNHRELKIYGHEHERLRFVTYQWSTSSLHPEGPRVPTFPQGLMPILERGIARLFSGEDITKGPELPALKVLQTLRARRKAVEEAQS